MTEAALPDSVGGSKRKQPRNARNKSSRKKLYALHNWVGFHLAAVMSLILFTGTIAVISNEIDWLIQKDMRVIPTGNMASWSAMESEIREFRPDDTIMSIFSMGSDYFAYRARMKDDYGKQYFIHINQWTGEVTGTSPTLTVQRFFRDLHRYLFMPNYIGLPLVTSFAFVLAISLYTGLKTARNWKTLAFRVRLYKGLRVALGDMHKATGLWSVWFFVVIVLTSIWYLAEFGSYLAEAPFEPANVTLKKARVAEFGVVIADLDADHYVAAAAKAFPELEPRSLWYPSKPGAPFSVQGRHKGSVDSVIVRDRANEVFLDPANASVIVIQKDDELGWAAYLNQLADPLHFGNFAGLVSKLIWFVFGAAMTGLSVTGVWLTWKRLKKSSLSKAQIATTPVLIAAVIFGFYWYDRQQGPDRPENEIAFGSKSFKDIQLHLRAGRDKALQPNGRFRLLATSPAGRVNIESVEFAIPDKNILVTAEPKTVGRNTAISVELPLVARFDVYTKAHTDLRPDGSDNPDGPSKLRATLLFANGEQFSTHWMLAGKAMDVASR